MRDLIVQTAVFVIAVFGVGAALGPSTLDRPVVRLTAGIVLGFLLQFAFGFAGFAFHLPNRVVAIGMAAGCVALIGLRHRAIRTLYRDAETRRFLASWALFAAWTLGLLSLIVTYSGGGWVADWVEHWQRTQFFLDRGSLDTRFAVIYSLPARPPLANLVTAVWLECTGRDFAGFQVYTTLFGSLIVLPAWLLFARGARSEARVGWLILLLMLSPLVAQNSTFAWTKLPTAFFVLTGIALLLETLAERSTDECMPVIASAALALGVLTHYSAAPWCVAIGVGLAWASRKVAQSRLSARIVAKGAGVFVAIVCIWAVWAWVHFGATSLQATTTVGAWHDQPFGQRLLIPLRNIFATLVPFPFRGEPVDGLIAQASALGRVRDVAFSLYQLNLPFALGTAGLWLVVRTLVVRNRESPNRPTDFSAGAERAFLCSTLPVAAILGILAHTPPDAWGLTQICLQPLVILGLVWAALELDRCPTGVRRVWLGLATLDFVLGIALHFGLESWLLRAWVAPGGSAMAYLSRLSRSAVANANDKAAFQFRFLSDTVGVPPAAVLLWLALCLGWVIFSLRPRARRTG